MQQPEGQSLPVTDVDLDMLFAEVPEFTPRQTTVKNFGPVDPSKPIYEISSAFHVTVDYCQTEFEARKHIQETGWRGWNLYEIHSGIKRLIDSCPLPRELKNAPLFIVRRRIETAS